MSVYAIEKFFLQTVDLVDFSTVDDVLSVAERKIKDYQDFIKEAPLFETSYSYMSNNEEIFKLHYDLFKDKLDIFIKDNEIKDEIEQYLYDNLKKFNVSYVNFETNNTTVNCMKYCNFLQYFYRQKTLFTGHGVNDNQPRVDAALFHASFDYPLNDFDHKAVEKQFKKLEKTHNPVDLKLFLMSRPLNDLACYQNTYKHDHINNHAVFFNEIRNILITSSLKKQMQLDIINQNKKSLMSKLNFFNLSELKLPKRHDCFHNPTLSSHELANIIADYENKTLNSDDCLHQYNDEKLMYQLNDFLDFNHNIGLYENNIFNEMSQHFMIDNIDKINSTVTERCYYRRCVELLNILVNIDNKDDKNLIFEKFNQGEPCLYNKILIDDFKNKNINIISELANHVSIENIMNMYKKSKFNQIIEEEDTYFENYHRVFLDIQNACKVNAYHYYKETNNEIDYKIQYVKNISHAIRTLNLIDFVNHGHQSNVMFNKAFLKAAIGEHNAFFLQTVFEGFEDIMSVLNKKTMNHLKNKGDSVLSDIDTIKDFYSDIVYKECLPRKFISKIDRLDQKFIKIKSDMMNENHSLSCEESFDNNEFL